MADEEDRDANDEEDEASEELMVLHINFVNLNGRLLKMKTLKRDETCEIWGVWK